MDPQYSDANQSLREAFSRFLTTLEVPPDDVNVQKLNELLLQLVLSDAPSPVAPADPSAETPVQTLRKTLQDLLTDDVFHNTGQYADFFKLASTKCEEVWNLLLEQLNLDRHHQPPQLYLAWLSIKDTVMDHAMEIATASLYTYFDASTGNKVTDAPMLESGAA